MKLNHKIGAVIFIALVVVFFIWTKGESVESYRTRLVAGVNQKLELNNNGIRKRIEGAHLTVTAKSAKVTSCVIRTIDGSNNAGREGSNVSEVDMVVTVFWDGYFQKNGYTELQVIYDAQNKSVKETKYLKSNAVFNMEKIDWFSVGYCAAAAISAL